MSDNPYIQSDINIDDASAFSAQNDPDADLPIIIKAVGVGGGGNNAVNHMYREGIRQVTFVNINTDAQALKHSAVPQTLQLGSGLGAGNKPEIAKQYAEEAVDRINELFDDDTKMVFITAGMGGGTGTGAAPVVARVAKERGLLTIGIVTIPFLFEGPVKIKKAIAGADEMAKYVDALLVINNERLNEIYGDIDFLNAFGKADDTLSIAARSISELITCEGRINLDFHDVDTTLRGGGAAIISTGYGSGERRVTAAIEDALNSPLLKNRNILDSKKLLFNIYFNPKSSVPLRMNETNELTEFIGSIQTEVDVIWGIGFDENLGDEVKITILASGFNVVLREEDILSNAGASRDTERRPATAIHHTPAQPKETPRTPSQRTGEATPQQTGGSNFEFGGGSYSIGTHSQGRATQPSADAKPHAARTPAPEAAPKATPAAPAATSGFDPSSISDQRVQSEYGSAMEARKSIIVLAPNQLDDDAVCDILERYPTYKRDRKIVQQVREGALAAPAPTQSQSQSTIPFLFS
ncbi:MAG: cell division protein FtsZ [Duncaniella sp.]|nr:cell division protein FtsZ [Duncaniella sp.]